MFSKHCEHCLAKFEFSTIINPVKDLMLYQQCVFFQKVPLKRKYVFVFVTEFLSF